MNLLKEILQTPSSPFRLSQKKKGLTLLCFALVFCEIFNILGFAPFRINNILLLALMSLIVITYGILKNPRINILYISYFTYLFINITLTNPPTVFKSWLRLGLFIGLLFCIAPVIENNTMRQFRMQCFKYVMVLAVPLSAISFFCYFLGINFIRSSFSHEITLAGTFSGLFQNSMLLGPISGISSCYSFWSYLNSKNKWWLSLFILCAGACMFSSSRSAVFGAAIGCMSIIIFSNHNSSKRIRQILAIGIVACASFPIWQGALSGIAQKNEANKSLGAYGSRTEKFEARIDEFKSSPLIGVGFASINPNGNDVYDHRTGVVEPGSSWLAVLSMTGLIGLAFIIPMYINAFYSSRKNKSRYGALLAGLIIYLTFHELFEGYMMAAGSTLCFISWLIIGVSSDLRYSAN